MFKAVTPSKDAKTKNRDADNVPGNRGFGRNDATGDARFTSKTEAIGATGEVYLPIGIGL